MDEDKDQSPEVSLAVIKVRLSNIEKDVERIVGDQKLDKNEINQDINKIWGHINTTALKDSQDYMKNVKTALWELAKNIILVGVGIVLAKFGVHLI